MKPVLPGPIGVRVHSASVQPQSVRTSLMTRSCVPLLVILKVAVLGVCHRRVPISWVVWSNDMVGCACTAETERNAAVRRVKKAFISS